MKTWKIPVEWSMAAIIEITADTIEEAIEITKEDFSIPLPVESEYIEDSWLVNEDIDYINILNNEV